MDQLKIKLQEYLSDDRLVLVDDALKFATKAHEGQMRLSGGPYINHPIAAAIHLADLYLDEKTIAATLLHDVVEDCEVPLETIQDRFGDEVAKLVDGVTKLKLLKAPQQDDDENSKSSNDRSENLRKMLVAMAEDIRVVLIKLADRLHNMQTLDALRPERQIEIAQETLDIYAPLAHRLGMGEMEWQLEDLAFRYLEPLQYKRMSRILSSKRKEREDYIQKIASLLEQALSTAGYHFEVTGRPKHLYSIYKKAQAYASIGKEISDIHDLFALRVIVNTISECYAALGIVHGLWRPLPGQFDDYIANPKGNMYQSLHTTVRTADGSPVEIQLRTYEMHQNSEYGVASHPSYKEGVQIKGNQFEERMAWLRQLLEWQREVSSSDEYVESIANDLFADQVFVYTPKNEIRELPKGATSIDFAYRIHTELGHRCIGAKINGRLVALDTQLSNGDTVEILTSKIARGPSLDWLNPHLGYVKTANARQSIRSWFRHQERDTNIDRGKDLLRKELRRLNSDIEDIEIAKWFRYSSENNFYAALGSGVVSVAQIAGRLTAIKATLGSQLDVSLNELGPVTATGVTVLGVGDLLTRTAECCSPLPGDQIVGFVTRTRGVTIHRQDCTNIYNVSEPERIVPVEWGQSRDVFPVRIAIESIDRMGLLHDITGATSTEHVNIAGSSTESLNEGTVIVHLTAQVTGLEQLSRLLSKIESVRGVKSVNRSLRRTP